jgi:hypothetical protein
MSEVAEESLAAGTLSPARWLSQAATDTSVTSTIKPRRG